MKRQFFYLGVGFVLLAAVFAGLKFSRSNGTGAQNHALKSATGKGAIGGPFHLVDQNGKRVSDADFKGRYMLIFFGYTSCPDVCPTALQGVGDMLDILGNDAAKIAPLFISVDPGRDTVDVLKAYVRNFHKNIIGLTGSVDQINAVTRAYRAYYSIGTDPTGKGENYTVNHSAYLYLMGPNGTFLTAFGYQISPQDMALKIKKYF